MIVNVTLVGDKALAQRMREMPRAVHQALLLKVTTLALLLEKLVKTGKLNGQVLNRITGALSRSIHNKVEQIGDAVIGRVFSSGDVKYAGIHEYGGVIHHPGGTAYITDPKREQMMLFVSNKSATADMPRTKAHDIRMPERSYLRSSLRDMSSRISTELKTAAVDAVRKQVEG